MGRGVLPAGALVATADDLGFTRGDGVFDATRICTDVDGNSTIDHLNRHFDRFDRSIAGVGGRAIDRQAWTALIEEAMAAWDVPGEAVCKIMYTNGQETQGGEPTECLTVTEMSAAAMAQRAGVKVAALNRGYAHDLFYEVPWLLGRVKTLAYAVNVAAGREAKARGADDVLFCSSDGYALEGPTSALIVWRDGVLHTTPLEGTGILDSITQALLFERATEAGYDCRYTLMRPGDVVAADAAWLASSVRGTVPILEVDGKPVSQDPELTRTFAAMVGF